MQRATAVLPRWLVLASRAIPGYHLGVESRNSHAAGTEHLLRVRHPGLRSRRSRNAR